jgi:hypothetical protein
VRHVWPCASKADGAVVVRDVWDTRCLISRRVVVDAGAGECREGEEEWGEFEEVHVDLRYVVWKCGMEVWNGWSMSENCDLVL